MIRRTVFVSYSRKDSLQVEQAVELLEAGGADVFRDIDDIQYGDRWEDVIREKLAEAERILVFWSINAQLSEWVGREWSIAITMQKRIVPILLDQTPLPTELGQFHALTNFMLRPQAPPIKPPKTYFTWGLLAVAGLGLAILISFAGLNLSKTSTDLGLTSNTPEQVTDSNLNTDPLTKSDAQTSYPISGLDPAIAASSTDLAIESQQQEQPQYLVWLSGFLVLLACIAYLVWQGRQRRQQRLTSEQLIKDIFQE